MTTLRQPADSAPDNACRDYLNAVQLGRDAGYQTGFAAGLAAADGHAWADGFAAGYAALAAELDRQAAQHAAAVAELCTDPRIPLRDRASDRARRDRSMIRLGTREGILRRENATASRVRVVAA